MHEKAFDADEYNVILKLHPLRDLEVAQFVASGRVRLGVRSP